MSEEPIVETVSEGGYEKQKREKIEKSMQLLVSNLKARDQGGLNPMFGPETTSILERCAAALESEDVDYGAIQGALVEELNKYGSFEGDIINEHIDSLRDIHGSFVELFQSLGEYNTQNEFADVLGVAEGLLSELDRKCQLVERYISM